MLSVRTRAILKEWINFFLAKTELSFTFKYMHVLHCKCTRTCKKKTIKYSAVWKTHLPFLYEAIKSVLIGTAFVELCWFTLREVQARTVVDYTLAIGKNIINVGKSLFLFVIVELEVWRCISFPYYFVWLCYLCNVVEIWSERQITCLVLSWLFARTKCRFSNSWKILRVYRTCQHQTCTSGVFLIGK